MKPKEKTVLAAAVLANLIGAWGPFIALPISVLIDIIRPYSDNTPFIKFFVTLSAYYYGFFGFRGTILIVIAITVALHALIYSIHKKKYGDENKKALKTTLNYLVASLVFPFCVACILNLGIIMLPIGQH